MGASPPNPRRSRFVPWLAALAMVGCGASQGFSGVGGVGGAEGTSSGQGGGPFDGGPSGGPLLAKEIALGAAHSCALTSRGIVCWGSAEFGQVGREVMAAALGPELQAVANARTKEINFAYDILSDAEKRSLYDRYGTAAFEGVGPGPRAGGGPRGGGTF